MTRKPVQQPSELEQLLHSLVDPILSIDRKGIILTANPAVEEVFGWEHDELLGQSVNVLMGEPYRSNHDNYIHNFLVTGEMRAIGRVRKVVGRRKDGQEFPCELSVSLVRQADDLRFFGIVRDITEREKMVARMAQVERLTAIGELAAGVAHEVNNPVNTIINCAQLLKQGEDDPALLDDIIQEGMRVATIVRDLLNFAREHRDEQQPTSIREVVERVLKLIGRRFERQDIETRTDIEEDLPEVLGRPHQLQQVLLSILMNARDALVTTDRPDRQILIRAATKRAQGTRFVSLAVRDNGPGIAPGDLEHVFDPFFTNKRQRGGTGLGLAVSQGIVEGHSGELRAASSPGEFAEFEILLPVPAAD